MNPSMFKGLEHPSGFPSMLRGSTPTPTDARSLGTPLHRKDSHGSTSQLRRHDSNGLTRRDSSNTSSLKRRDSFGSGLLNRKDSAGSTVLGRRDSTDTKSTHAKRDSVTDDFRRMSLGSSIYLRPDSSGETHLIHRDAFGRKDSADTGKRIPRDYVSKSSDSKIIVHDDNCELAHSILRKGDDNNTNKENVDHKLTSANLSKHVTILDENSKNDENGGRRDSSGSLLSGLRRMSVDSLDARRRGSSASAADLGFSTDPEVSSLYILLTGIEISFNKKKMSFNFTQKKK